MSLVAAIGEGTRVGGFALGGAIVFAAEDAPSIRRAWEDLTDEVAVLLLTPAAAAVLGDVLELGQQIYAVIPP